MVWLMYGVCFGSAALVGITVYPPMARRIAAYINRKVNESSEQLSDLFIDLPYRTVALIFIFSPPAIGLLAWSLTGSGLVGVFATVAGLFMPSMAVRYLVSARQAQFEAQLVDALLVLSSSLKAGLSLLQAFNVLSEEMPPPISQEFGLVLKESQMGVTLEDALLHLKARMPSDSLTLFVTSVLVARETGGNVTQIFARLVETMRERAKLKERIKTLTFMARLQGLVMMMLPVLFAFVVYNMDHNYFQFFLTNPLGRVLLVVVCALQVVGTLMFLRFSRSPM